MLNIYNCKELTIVLMLIDLTLQLNQINMINKDFIRSINTEILDNNISLIQIAKHKRETRLSMF